MKNSTANKIKAKLAFHNVSDSDAQQQFITVLQGLKNNPAFTNPPVDMATYEKGVDSFRHAAHRCARWRQEGHQREGQTACGGDQDVYASRTLRRDGMQRRSRNLQYQWFHRSCQNQDCAGAAGRFELPMDRSRSQ